MRSPRSSTEYQEAVARRLALLSADLHPMIQPQPWAEADAPASTPGPAAPPATSVPRPGRHACRRAALPRVALGRAQLGVVAVAVTLGLALTCWWLLRAEPRVVAPLATDLPAAGMVTPAGPTLSPGAATSPSAIVVDVAGKVRRPGIAVLDPGARVVDAIEAAGGARPGVDLGSLNLARLLVDGEQVVVGEAAPAAAATGPPTTGDPPAGTPVNLNTADQTQLESLPEVGPVTAQAIIGWREEHGGFTAVDELLDVDGIGEATLSRIAPLVTV